MKIALVAAVVLLVGCGSDPECRCPVELARVEAGIDPSADCWDREDGTVGCSLDSPPGCFEVAVIAPVDGVCQVIAREGRCMVRGRPPRG